MQTMNVPSMNYNDENVNRNEFILQQQDELPFACVCLKKYKTEAGLRQHQRRYCRIYNIQNNDDNNDINNIQSDELDALRLNVVLSEKKCKYCPEEFNSYAGVRQHTRQAHLKEYNAELEKEAQKPKRSKLWTNLEISRMGEIEMQFIGSEVELNKHIAVTLGRSIESIRCKRRFPSYKELVSNKRNENNAPPPTGMQSDDSIVHTEDAIDPIACFLNEIISDTNESRVLRILSGSKEELDAMAEELIQTYGSSRPLHRRDIPGTPPNSNASRRKRRAYEHKVTQRKYKRNRKRYAQNLLDNKELISCQITPDANAIEMEYRQVFELPSPIDDFPIVDVNRNATNLYKPITKEEVSEAIKKTPNDTSPGPDGISFEKLKSIPINELILLFNAMFYLQHVPLELLRSTTALIPKTEENLENVKNWRPITMSSLILRIC